MKQKRSCSNCLKGSKISINDDILCRYKGVVSPDYSCQKHRFIPVPKTVRSISSKCADCEFFIFEFSDSREPSSIGLCQLFSVRHFDGRQKNACSKFSKRSEKDVS